LLSCKSWRAKEDRAWPIAIKSPEQNHRADPHCGKNQAIHQHHFGLYFINSPLPIHGTKLSS